MPDASLARICNAEAQTQLKDIQSSKTDRSRVTMHQYASCAGSSFLDMAKRSTHYRSKQQVLQQILRHHLWWGGWDPRGEEGGANWGGVCGVLVV